MRVGCPWRYIPCYFGRWNSIYKKFNQSSKSRAGLTTKIHLAVDSYGLPIEFMVTGGEVHDSVVAADLIEKLPNAEAIMADKGYNIEKIRDQIEAKGAMAVTPRKSNSLIGNDGMDWAPYKYRHLVENSFARLKHFRAIVTRYEKLTVNWLPWLVHFYGCLCDETSTDSSD
jgi:transposase